MRVKKYKRVKRPKIYVDLPGSVKEQEATGGKVEVSATPDHPEESDHTVEEKDEQLRDGTESDVRWEDEKGPAKEGRPSVQKQGRLTTPPNAHLVDEMDGRGNALVWPKDSIPTHGGGLTFVQKKSGNQTISDEDADIVKALPTTAPPGAIETGSVKEHDGKQDEIQTTNASACCDVLAIPQTLGVNFDNDGENTDDENVPNLKLIDTDVPAFCEEEEDGNESYNQDETTEDSDSNSTAGDKVLAMGGSLWFKAERLVTFLQLLALALEVEGAEWPPVFVAMWDWAWFTTDYLRWPFLVLLRRVGHSFSLTFGEQELELWFFRDVVGYGVEICAASVAVFVLFFVLQMPDYTSPKPKAAWKHSFLTHWFKRTLPWYILKLCLCYGVFAALAFYGSSFFPVDVVAAVIVVGGTLITVSWMFIVLLSFLVHVTLRVATKHEGEYSFMIALVRANGIFCNIDKSRT